MNSQIHELSYADLDDVSGGMRSLLPPTGPVPPNAPFTPPPIIIPIPILPPTHGPFFAPPGTFER